MLQKNCNKIKDLEKRLACLKEKYERLTRQIGGEIINTVSQEDSIEYQQLIEERELIEKYMQKVEKQLFSVEHQTVSMKDSDEIDLGKIITLKNSDHSLTFRLVEEIFSSDEKQISTKSPIGKAVQGKRVGETVKVTTPRGKIQYVVKAVE